MPVLGQEIKNMISCPSFAAELQREKTLYWCGRRQGITKSEPQHCVALKKRSQTEPLCGHRTGGRR